MTVSWSTATESDLADVYAYLSAESPDAPVRVIDRLLAAAEGLARFPFLGRPGRLEGRRELVVDQYIVVYRVRRAEVRILSLEHGARRR